MYRIIFNFVILCYLWILLYLLLFKVFDAFVVIVSWCLDVAFWEGLWAHPEAEAANIMIFILPWRVVRIVNSKCSFQALKLQFNN